MNYDEGGYGGLVARRLADGTVVVDRADDVIGVAAELIANLEPGHIRNGMLVFDTAGEYEYLPSHFDHGGVIVCYRRCKCNTWATRLSIGYPNGHHPSCDKQPDSDVRASWQMLAADSGKRDAD